MSNVVIDKDELMLLINECKAIKEKKFALECLDKDPDKFIRLLFRVMNNLFEGLKTKENTIQETLKECNKLQGKLNDANELISDLRKGITNYENNW